MIIAYASFLQHIKIFPHVFTHICTYVRTCHLIFSNNYVQVFIYVRMYVGVTFTKHPLFASTYVLTYIRMHICKATVSLMCIRT